MKRAYKYRFYPTAEQAELLAKTFGCVRFVHNSILQWRSNAFRERQEKIGYAQASARLTELKKEPGFAWLNEVSCVPLQQSLRHQQTAFKNFFDGRARYPAFKSKRNRNKQAAEFTASAFKYVDGKLYIAKSQIPLNVRWSRPLPSTPSRVTITLDSAGRYFVSCLCEFEPVPLPLCMTTVLIDRGLNGFFASDNGDEACSTRKYEKRLVRLQQRLYRKVKGSKNRAKARVNVARLRAKIADCRMDRLHKLSRTLINENQVVCVGALKVDNRMPPPTQSNSITDECWGEFVRQLQYKALWAGRTVAVIDSFAPSTACCSSCRGNITSRHLDVRCASAECSSLHDRDNNATVISTLPGWQC